MMSRAKAKRPLTSVKEQKTIETRFCVTIRVTKASPKRSWRCWSRGQNRRVHPLWCTITRPQNNAWVTSPKKVHQRGCSLRAERIAASSNARANNLLAWIISAERRVHLLWCTITRPQNNAWMTSPKKVHQRGCTLRAKRIIIEYQRIGKNPWVFSGINYCHNRELRVSIQVGYQSIIFDIPNG